MIKKFLKKLLEKSGYAIMKIKDYKDPIIDADEKFIKIYDACKKYTMTNKERMYALYKAVQYTVSADIPGDFVECGVWKGGNTMLIAYTLLDLGVKDKKIYLYDTFEGMTQPTENDHSLSNKDNSVIDRWEKEQEEDHNKWCYASLPEVTHNMNLTKYPADKIVFVKGKVEETIPKIIPTTIAVLRLDTDWYESTKHELDYLFPLLSKNSVLILDDYGCWSGSKKAVDEYFVNKTAVLLNRIDRDARLIIKTE